MGRRAGVTSEEMRAKVLQAAAVVFGRLGFERTKIADITAEAGTSSTPIYVHFGGKAGLFAATLEAHIDNELDAILGRSDPQDVDATGLLAGLGSALSRKQGRGRSLAVEAVVAARRDPDVSRLVGGILAERHRRLVQLIERGQAAGEIDARVSPQAVARFSLVVALGALLVDALELPPADPDEWSGLIGGVVRSMRQR